MNDIWMTKTEIIEKRGWTDAAIKRFLGAPEEIKPNPRYKSASPMKLWRLETVRSAEKNAEFIAWKSEVVPRRDRAKEQHQKRKSLLMEWIESLEIEIPKYNKEQLFRLAIADYNDLWNSRGKYEKFIYGDYKNLDPSFLSRITMNMLLHALSDYEFYLEEVVGKTGASEARAKLKDRILVSIQKTYPKLSNPEIWILQDEIETETKQDAETGYSEIIAAITDFSKRLARLIASDPKGLIKVEWRDMERMLAAVFEGLGFSVTLTPPSKDGGKDLILECMVTGSKKNYIVEVKHWTSGQRVGKRYISDFIEVIARESRDGGLYLATYGYSENVFEALTEVDREVVKLGVDKKVVSLCRTYIKAESGVWSVPSSLSDLLFENVL